MRWNMLFFALLFICMATCSLCVHCVIHSLFWLSTHDFCVSMHVRMCISVYLAVYTVHVCIRIAVHFVFTSMEPSSLHMMGQFKFGVLIKSRSLNLAHNICIIPTNYLQLCCERGTLMTCRHSFIHSFIREYIAVVCDANSITSMNCMHTICFWIGMYTSGMLSTVKSWVKSYMHIKEVGKEEEEPANEDE